VEVEEEISEDEEKERFSLEESPAHPLTKRRETRLRTIKRDFDVCISFSFVGSMVLFEKKEKEKGCTRGFKTRDPFRGGVPSGLAYNILLTLEVSIFLAELILFLFLGFPGGFAQTIKELKSMQIGLL